VPDEVDAVRTKTNTAWNSKKMGHRAVDLLVHLPPSVTAEMELRRWKGVKSADWDAHCIVRGETSLQTGREFSCFDRVSVVTLILCSILQTRRCARASCTLKVTDDATGHATVNTSDETVMPGWMHTLPVLNTTGMRRHREETTAGVVDEAHE